MRRTHSVVVLAVLLWLLVTLADQAGAARPLRLGLERTILPGVIVVTRLTAGGQAARAYLQLWRDGWRRWGELEQENVRLRAEVHALRQAQAENEALREQLQVPHDRFVRVAALSGSGTQWWMQAGCRDGVRSGDPVLNAERSLVGVVRTAGTSFSALDTLLSPDWRLPVRVGSASAMGLMHTKQGLPQVAEVPASAPVGIGDLVVTAGNDRIESGIVVGTITAIEKRTGFAVQNLTMEPATIPADQAYVHIRAESESTCQ